VEALALLEQLNADLLSHDSATETLRRWCAAHRLAGEAAITAERVRGADKPPDAAVLAALGAPAAGQVRYRHVRLACAGRVLSEADNWYLPARLTAEMNRVLDETDTPFGVVVRPLDFERRTLSAELLFKPLADGWDTAPPADAPGLMVIPPAVIQHRAVLSTPDGRPFSLVVETYTDKVLPDRAP
jgi:chorismate-pyruvate lyase